jgi:molybdenum cofactor guanylyltransferase
MIAAIQAGGRSTRMKTDKAWLEIESQPMIERVLFTAQHVAEKIFIVIHSENSRTSDYEKMSEKFSARILIDAHDFRGPLGGIETVLRQISDEESVLILACDLPFISVEFLQFLISVHQASSAFLTVPTDEQGRPQMLCAIYSAACRHEISRMLDGDELKTRLLGERVPTNIIGFDEYQHLPNAENFLLNLNTPDEYKAFASNESRG